MVYFVGVYAYDFSYTYQGITLYYNIIDRNRNMVEVVPPNNYDWAIVQDLLEQ